MALARHCAVFTYTYYLVNVILLNKQYFQIKITNNLHMCRLIAEAWSIHTVIVMFQHELFVHSDAALVRHCDSLTFVYILPPELPNCILFIKQDFQIKRTNKLQRV